MVQMWLIMLVDNHSTTIDDQPCNETSRLLFHIKIFMIDQCSSITGWQKLREGTKGPCQKVWIGTKKITPNIRYFVATLRFVAFYALFGDLWAKKVPFWVKNSVSWARSAPFLGVYCILY